MGGTDGIREPRAKGTAGLGSKSVKRGAGYRCDHVERVSSEVKWSREAENSSGTSFPTGHSTVILGACWGSVGLDLAEGGQGCMTGALAGECVSGQGQLLGHICLWL